jgi:hypothetical protein
MNIDALIAAYKHELAGYRRRGLVNRAKLVEAELRRLGYSEDAKPLEDVLTEPTSTPTVTPDAPQTPHKAAKDAPAPKRLTTGKKR